MAALRESLGASCPDAARPCVLRQAAGGSDLTGAALGQLFERLGQPLDAEQEAVLRARFDVAGRDHRVSFSEARSCKPPCLA